MNAKKGGPNDDVAQNIRSAQAQDAMPSSGAKEHDHQPEQECSRCGTVSTTVRLRDPLAYSPSCPGLQSPRQVPLCDECNAQREAKEDAIRQHFAEGDDYVVEYACGALHNIDVEVAKRKAGHDDIRRVPHRGWSPSVPLKHNRCGSVIKQVWEPDDLEDEGDD